MQGLITGTYILQGNRAAFNQYTVDAPCKLCLAAPETRHHFIAECSAYALEREVYVEKLRNNPVLPDSLKNCLTGPDFLTQFTLDESGSFRSYSRSVRSFRPVSFRPDFRDKSFRLSWGGSFRPNFKGGSFRSDFRVGRFGMIYLFWENRKDIRLSSP